MIALNKTALSARYKSSADRKLMWHSLLSDAYDYTLPQRNTFDHQRQGQRKNRHIFDSTACQGARGFSNVMQFLLTPSWKEFSKITAGELIAMNRDDEDVIAINKQLQDITDIHFEHLNHSNFHNEIAASYLDLSVGTGAVMCNWLEDRSTGLGNFVYKSIPLRNLVLEEGPQGSVENVWRHMKVTVEHAKRLWPGFSTKQQEDSQSEKQANQRKEFKEAVLFDPETSNYHQVVVDQDFDVRFEKNLGPSNPWIVFRFNVNPDEVYGRGPGIDLLPDIRTLNKIVEFTLRNAALSVSNIYTQMGGQEASFNPFTVNLQPNMIIPVQSNDNRNPTLKALERSGDINFADLLVREYRDMIKKGYLNSLVTPDGPVRSATEISIERNDLVQQHGAEFGRLETELIEKLISRNIHLLVENNVIPPMKIDGRAITLKHTSPVARAQDLEELLSLQNSMATIAQAGLTPQDIAPSVKVEDLPAWIHTKNGGDPNLLRTPEEKIEFQQKAVEAAEVLQAGDDSNQAA